MTDSERSPTYGCYWHGNEPSSDVKEGPATTLRKREYEPMKIGFRTVKCQDNLRNIRTECAKIQDVIFVSHFE